MAPLISSARKLLLYLFVSITLPSFGQGRDTAFAIHKLFQQRRGSGDTWAATGLGVAVEESTGWRANRSTSDNATSAAVYGGIPLLMGLRQAQRFSAEREMAILNRYAEGWSIPPDIRRKLRRKHFHRTSHDVPPDGGETGVHLEKSH